MIDDRLVSRLTENRHHTSQSSHREEGGRMISLINFFLWVKYVMLVNSNLKVVLKPPSPLKYIFSLYYIPIASSFRLREALIFGPFLYSP